MAKTYDAVPVFRSSNYDRPEDFIGSANVVVSENGKTTIVMEISKDFNDFLDLGDLKALSLSGFVTGVDSEKGREYGARVNPKKEESNG